MGRNHQQTTYEFCPGCPVGEEFAQRGTEVEFVEITGFAGEMACVKLIDTLGDNVTDIYLPGEVVGKSGSVSKSINACPAPLQDGSCGAPNQVSKVLSQSIGEK